MIDRDTAKAHLHVEHTDEDALIDTYIAAAKAAIEGEIAKYFEETPVTETLDGFPRSCSGDKPIRLWYGPVGGITSIKYDDSSGVEQTLADFRLIEGDNAQVLPAFNERWPATIAGRGTVRVTYPAGYATGEVPPSLDMQVLKLVAYYYESREAAAEIPKDIAHALMPFRTPRLG